jgi:Zn-dependent M16 (insulinase) family peptidase
MGVASMDYKELSEQIELKTGGLDVSPHIAEHHSDPNKFEQASSCWLSIRSRPLACAIDCAINKPFLFELLLKR